MRLALAALVLSTAVAAPALAPSLARADASRATALDVSAGIVDGATGAALARAGAVVVDVRTPQEFAAGHVPGALNIPHEELPRRAAEIGPPGTPIVLYCRSGRRSGIAGEALRAAGYAKVWDAQRFDAWPRDEGLAGR